MAASILFICHGNICRSPYAAEALRSNGLLDGRNIDVDSAGFIGPDRPSPPEARAVSGRRGVDLEAHRSRLMDTRSLAETHLIVVMDARQQRAVRAMSGRSMSDILVLGDLDPEPIRRRAITDPWGQPEAVFDEVYARIDRCVNEMARLLTTASGAEPATTTPGDDG